MTKVLLTDEQRKAIDNTIACKVIEGLLFAGYEISVDNGAVEDDFAIKKSKDTNAILDAMFKTQRDVIYIADSRIDVIFQGYVHLEYGRKGFAVIGNCSENVKPAIRKALELAAYMRTRYAD